jgi:hypothetical protein
MSMYVCVCVCLCVLKSERERESEVGLAKEEEKNPLLLFSIKMCYLLFSNKAMHLHIFLCMRRRQRKKVLCLR